LRRINDKMFVDLKGTAVRREALTEEAAIEPEELSNPQNSGVGGSNNFPPHKPGLAPEPDGSARRRKVFITHGKNRALIEPIKKLLTFGDLEAVVSVYSQTASQPVPVKIMDER